MQTGNVSFGKVRPIIVDRTIDKSFRENLEKKAPAAQNNYRLEDFTDYYAKQNFDYMYGMPERWEEEDKRSETFKILRRASGVEKKIYAVLTGKEYEKRTGKKWGWRKPEAPIEYLNASPSKDILEISGDSSSRLAIDIITQDAFYKR